jgi:DNA-binding NarL/FixJ family response regulator/tetratricopeptide (TPR) repeat protein
MLRAGGLAVSALAAPLVGRTRELERLHGVIEAVALGAGHLVVISGEPGIGKSRLLEELVRHAEARGCVAFYGRAAEFETERPFGPLVDACDEYLASLDARTAERVVGDGAAELAGVFPSLRPLVTQPAPIGLADERYRAHRAFRELLERLAKRTLIVLALDDLHWADAASIELVSHLVRKRPRGGVGLAVAFRSGRAPRMLAAALEDAEERRLERIELGPLDAALSYRLLEGFEEAEWERIYRESGGNPFYLEQLARAPSASGSDEHAGVLADDGAPPAVVNAIVRELDQLPDGARALARGAAVAGDPFELDIAAEAAAVLEPEALVALDELLAPGLVRATEVPRRFRFRHPLVRRAVYQSCAAGWRLGAHGRAASALQQRGASPVERAHHVVASARRGDTDAVALLRAAGDRVASRAPASAARWYEAALRLLPEEPAGVATRVDLLEALGRSLGASGRLADSYRALSEALELAPADAQAQRARLLTSCVSIEHVIGRHASARERLLDALAHGPPVGSREAVTLRILLAVTSVYAGDFERMRSEAEAALGAATALSDQGLRGYARAVVAFCAYRRGETGAARTALEPAIADFADVAADQLAAPDLFAFVGVGTLSRYLERYEDAGRFLTRGIELSRSSGQGHVVLPLLCALANTAAALGDIREALNLCEDALDAARLAGSPMGELMALRGQSWVSYLAGDVAGAIAAGERSLELRRAVDESHLSARAPVGLPAALVESGGHERAIELLTEAGGPRVGDAPMADRCACYELLARAALALGRLGEADECAKRAEALVAGTGLPVSSCYARRTRAAVLLAAGDSAGAARLASEAAQEAEAAAARLEAARSRTLAGKALAAAGERARAIAALEAAAETLEQCGAVRFRREATRELRRLGRRMSGRSRPGMSDAEGIACLSGRELEVAELVVDRRTNAEIAGALVLSEKTIESHLRNIFRKLGVSSRVELARRVEQSTRS